jgi:hypothetical protein
MALLDFTIFAIIAAIVEFSAYKYMSSEDKFKVSQKEKDLISSDVKKVLNMGPNKMIEISRTLRDGVANSVEHEPVREMLLFTWGLSEETLWRTADHYGTQLTNESKRMIDDELLTFAKSYSKGSRLEVYDSISKMFKNLMLKRNESHEMFDKTSIAQELSESSKALAKGEVGALLDLLSKYSQRSIEDANVLLFINALNDLMFRVKSKLCQGPTYFVFLKAISKNIRNAAQAIERGNDLKLFKSYEEIFKKAAKSVDKFERFSPKR